MGEKIESQNSRVCEELITPSVAVEYLKRNVSNRPLRETAVRRYAQLMSDGLWGDSTDCIGFDKDGNLINGQHRLRAIIKSGKSYVFTVKRDCSDDAFAFIDNGVGRTAGDTLSIYGAQNGNQLAAIVSKKKMYDARRAAICSTSGHANMGITNLHIVQEYKLSPGQYDDALKKARFWNSYKKLMTISDFGGLYLHLVYTMNHREEDIVRFLNELSGREVYTNNVISLFERVLVQEKATKKRLVPTKKMALLIKTFNAWMIGKTVKVLNYNEINDKNLWFV